MKQQGQASNSSGLGRIAPLPDSNPTRGRPLCNRKKMMGRNVNPGLTEPFRIDHNMKHGRNAQSKSAEFTSVMKAEREKLMPRLKADDVSLEELAGIFANYVSLAKYHQSCACCDDLSRSLDARLFGGKTGHASKLPKYRNHLTELSGDDGRIELGYLI